MAAVGVALVLATPALAAPGELTTPHYTVHYNALSGAALPEVSTRTYGLRHSADQGLVTVTANANDARQANLPFALQGHASTLLGASIPLKIRYVHDDGDGFSALVTFRITASQTVHFVLDVTPYGGKTSRLDFSHDYVR